MMEKRCGRHISVFPMEARAMVSENQEDLFIEGYFAVFGAIYEMWPGGTESIAPGAFDDSLGGDVRALYNHNCDLVLGRTISNTLEIRQDSKGLWGKIKINKDDTDAVNAYRRIQRGDITGCSFGFEIEKESVETRLDGSVHWTIEKVNPLYEISPCVFPAYVSTSIAARKAEYGQIKKRRLDAWRSTMKARIRNGT